MTPIRPRVPEGAEVYSSLYRTTDPEYLTQDVLAISLPNGFQIDVGWFPEHDPEGHYVIRVFYQYWDAQKILPVRVNTVDEVLQVVESLADRFSSGVVVASSTPFTTREFSRFPTQKSLAETCGLRAVATSSTARFSVGECKNLLARA